MYITKVSEDKQTGVKRWFATASGVKEDLYEERMSVGLFRDFIKRIEDRSPVPAPFSSSAWNGGLPYLSVSHYHDLNGYGIAGDTEQMFIDGDLLKARGTFAGTKLAAAAYDRIRADIKDNIPQDKRVRVSIAFIDYGHDHEGFGTFRRKALTDTCSMCEQGLKHKVYTDGHLVHLALTRRPAYPETAFELESRSDMTTSRQTDAESIVGKEEAEELEKRQQKLVGRSVDGAIDPNALVVKEEGADAEPEGDVEPVTEAEPIVEKGGGASKKKPKKFMKREGHSEDVATGTSKSLGGAQTLDEAEKFLSESGQATVLDVWGVLSGVIDNITGGQFKAEIEKAMGDFQSLIDVQTAKSVSEVAQWLQAQPKAAGKLTVKFVEPVAVIDPAAEVDLEEEEGEPEGEGEPEARTELQTALDVFAGIVEKLAAAEGTSESKLLQLVPETQKLSIAIRAAIEGKPVTAPAPAPVSQDVINEAVAKALVPLQKQIEELKSGVKVVEKQGPASPLRRAIRSRMDLVPGVPEFVERLEAQVLAGEEERAARAAAGKANLVSTTTQELQNAIVGAPNQEAETPKLRELVRRQMGLS
jgi:hypothetical protein